MMLSGLRVFVATGAIVCACAGQVHAQELTEAEKIYAELATLSPEDRQQRILEGAEQEGELNVISSVRGEITRDQIALFSARYPFLQVNVSETGSQDAAERVIAEETAGQHLTDVAGVAVPDLRELVDLGFLAVYPTPAVHSILPEYSGLIDPEHRWTPFLASEYGIAYNTNLVAPEDVPTDWFDLCDPKFSGMISLEPLTIRFLYGVYRMMGEEKLQSWLECIAANDPIIQRGHTQRNQLMMAGDHSISPNQYFFDGVAMKAADPSVPFGYTTDVPVLIYASANVINKNTPHPYASALFVDWHLSEEWQDYLVNLPRGPIAAQNPYIPAGTELVVYGYGTDEEYEKITALWRQYITE